MGIEGIYCAECRKGFGSFHAPDCPWFCVGDNTVQNEHCGSPIVWEPQSEVGDSPADPDPLELHLFDHLDLSDKV